MVMPRVGVPPYPIAGGVDDLDEDTPPIIPQFTCEYGGAGMWRDGRRDLTFSLSPQRPR